MLHRLLTWRSRSAHSAAFAVLLLGGCGGGGTPEAPEVASAAIVNGERSVAADDGVVQVTTRPSGSVAQGCTGTLVAPNIVLTALHCLAPLSSGAISCSADGTVSSTTPGAGSLGELASPEQVEIRTGVYPGTNPDAYGAKLFGTGSNQICRNDLAVVVLDRDLALPLSALRLARGVELGELMRAVGYGATESSSSVGRFERDALQVIDRGLDAGGSTASMAAPHTVVIGEGPCHGDSGGPLFSEETGALVGVYSLVSGATCTALGVRNVYTRLAPFAELVQSAFDFAMQTPILEQDPSSGGADAAAGDSSSSAGPGAGGSGAAPSTSGAASSASGGLVQRPGGSGSIQDASCACRAGVSRRASPLGLGALLCGFGLLRRRRGRRAGARAAQ